MGVLGLGLVLVRGVGWKLGKAGVAWDQRIWCVLGSMGSSGRKFGGVFRVGRLIGWVHLGSCVGSFGVAA